MIFALIIMLMSLGCYADTHTAASCSASDVGNLQVSVSDGDTIQVPAGNCTWTNSSSYFWIDRENLTLQGAGIDQTVINLGVGASYNAVLVIGKNGATVKGFTFQGCSGCDAIWAIKTYGSATNFRITGNRFTGKMSSVFYTEGYGVIDSNVFEGAVGNEEMIFTRGSTNSWQTVNSIGGSGNVFIENNTFSGVGYVSDCNSNARCVVRYNTISGPIKIDGHGKASNTPARGIRNMEIYNNRWTYTATDAWPAIELRGGTGRIFNNVIDLAGNGGWVYLTEYGASATWPNFGNVCQCPSNYPIDDQVGVGMDPKSGGSEPVYLWNNTKNGSALTLNWHSVSNCTATCGSFTMEDIIQENRDYYMSTTKPAAMSGYTPYTCPHPLVGAGSCNESVAGTSGYTVGEAPAGSPSGSRMRLRLSEMLSIDGIMHGMRFIVSD